MYLTYSSVKKLVVINDPLSGSHFMDAVSFKTEYTLSHVTANVDDRPLPSYLCFNEVGNGCAIAEHSTFPLFILGLLMNCLPRYVALPSNHKQRGRSLCHPCHLRSVSFSQLPIF